ncbi:MAG: hypothetical protein O3C40_31715 [Planctomycetota bacterium]|nr:hypothetical protein [Planctomycetota bacterium]
MSYDANNHAVYSERTKNWCKAAQNLIEEAKRLDAIYVNETASGADPEFVANGNGTTAEHQDVVTMWRAYIDYIEGSAVATLDRRPVLSPFTQQA